MACFLAVIEKPTECEGCGDPLPPGYIGLTDEIHGPEKLAPQCRGCTLAQDRRLGMVLIGTFAGLPLEQVDEIIEKTFKTPEFAKWRELVDEN